MCFFVVHHTTSFFPQKILNLLIMRLKRFAERRNETQNKGDQKGCVVHETKTHPTVNVLRSNVERLSRSVLIVRPYVLCIVFADEPTKIPKSTKQNKNFDLTNHFFR